MIKLLHVEDDEDIREIAQMSLDISGEFEVTQCTNGPDALKKVEKFSPDVILLDMMMPGMTGIETLAEMRKLPHLVDVPALFMTARAQTAEMEELRGVGATDVITKPFDPMMLAQLIKDGMAK